MYIYLSLLVDPSISVKVTAQHSALSAPTLKSIGKNTKNESLGSAKKSIRICAQRGISFWDQPPLEKRKKINKSRTDVRTNNCIAVSN